MNVANTLTRRKVGPGITDGWTVHGLDDPGEQQHVAPAAALIAITFHDKGLYMHTIKKSAVAVISTLGLMFGAHAMSATVKQGPELRPTGKGWGMADLHAARPSGGGKTSNGISYHGGPIILNGTHVYYIWYGNWSGNTATTILANAASGLSGSPYFNINTTYYNGSNVHVTNAVSLLNTTTDNYSLGTALSDSNVQSIVANAISSGRLPSDSNAVYFVLTSADVNETSGFCTSYCGWHNHASIGGVDIKYAFVGNPDRCPSACEAQSSSSPNNNPGADGMVSIFAHELEEATTDPDLNAWYDSRGQENADKCAWKFGTEYTTSNGSLANMSMGGYNYLIQQNWVNASGGYCALKY